MQDWWDWNWPHCLQSFFHSGLQPRGHFPPQWSDNQTVGTAAGAVPGTNVLVDLKAASPQPTLLEYRGGLVGYSGLCSYKLRMLSLLLWEELVLKCTFSKNPPSGGGDKNKNEKATATHSVLFFIASHGFWVRLFPCPNTSQYLNPHAH